MLTIGLKSIIQWKKIMEKKIKTFSIALIVLCTFIILIPQSLFARTNDTKIIYIPPYHRLPPTLLPDGFYVGVSGNDDIYRVKANATVTLSTSTTITTRGPGATLFGGYGQYFCNFYYGGELGIATSGASSSYDISSISGNYRLDANVRMSLAASLLAGMKLTPPVLMYARVGAVRTLLNTHESTMVGGVNSNDTDNQWSDGVRFGIGIETTIFRPLSMRFEYNHTIYGTEGTDFGTRYTISQGQFALGLIYHFVC